MVWPLIQCKREEEFHEESMSRALKNRRESKLFEAAIIGDVDSLNELMEEDSLTLTRISVTCFDENPLHISAMLGHANFTRLILTHSPNMATELNFKGQTPLHLAAATGHVKIVKQLLSANYAGDDAYRVRDEDGCTPLHLAVKKGRVKVIKELIQVSPRLHFYTSDKGETILHFCVKHNRVEAFKIMIDMGSEIKDIVNVKDENDDGNTVLHIATYLKQTEVVKYLLSRTCANVYALNVHNHKAIDMVEYAPKDFKSKEIREIIVHAGASSRLTIHSASPSPSPFSGSASSRVKSEKRTERNEKDNKKNKNLQSLIVAATLIAGMAYQAILSPPGGLFDHDGAKDYSATIGTSVMAYTRSVHYSYFWVCNTVSLVSSLSIILLYVSGLSLKIRSVMWILRFSMWIAVTSMAISYLISMLAISSEEIFLSIEDYSTTPSSNITTYSPTAYAILISYVAWIGLMCIIFLAHIVSLVIWMLKKVGRCTRGIWRKCHAHETQHLIDV